MREERRMGGERESVRLKEQREKKVQVHDAKTLRIKIYSSEANGFPEKLTFEEMVEGIKKRKIQTNLYGKENNK